MKAKKPEPAKPVPEIAKRYETREVKLTDLIDAFTRTLPASTDWKVLAIDVHSDVIVVKREIKDSQ